MKLFRENVRGNSWIVNFNLKLRVAKRGATLICESSTETDTFDTPEDAENFEDEICTTGRNYTYQQEIR